jgi:uncharacterized protein HemX
MQSQEIRNNLAKIIAFRIVDDREMVVDFLRSRTNYEIPEDCSNEYLASVLSDMTFDEKKQEKLAKLITKDVEFLNYVQVVLLIITIIGTGAAVYKDIRVTQEARESAISGLTLQQVDYDKQMIENREKMSKDFFANILKNEKEIQEQKRQVIVKEKQKNLIYLVIFIAILTASFSLVLKK